MIRRRTCFIQILFYLTVLFRSTWSSFPGGNCIEPCIAEMQQVRSLNYHHLCAFRFFHLVFNFSLIIV
ncbi:hypothetical protein B9Z55_008303 [Caenorhabditis nigoni]|uniref:Secreted protein n=1 Tax=Caenorhabditis nigoni TaxID=1611254 RepID=A0A2G5VDM5_9PELO|nr:hypothetical protein B9Z55_008303 [Caenorhabditis nigoni]